MKTQFIYFFGVILSINCYSQISFEKGYYIDNTNQKINCLIKNIDWRSNPTEFEYKLTEKREPEKANIKSVKEFGVDNISKYIRATINIDRSSNNINDLSGDQNPIFNEEELFLKILVEGKSNLYEYTDGSLIRYFYSKENGDIEQLIYKIYKFNETTISYNNKYKQQLWTDLKCPSFEISKIERLDYNKKELVQFFTEYSKCNNYNIDNFEIKQKKDLFNLNIRPRVNSSSLTLQNSITNSQDTNFDNKIGYGLGLEAEFILPYNKNKWAILIEPSYQNFNSEKTINVNNVSEGILIAKVNYSSIEIPVSLRHYFFLNNRSKFFINASYVFDFSSKSSIEFTRNDGSNFNSLEIETRNNLAVGIGFRQNDRYSLEIRYQANREILGSYSYWSSEYKTLSIIFGYSLF